ncbi:BREX system P-loop protein BrxC [Bradyrhizobium sp. Ash2021]|uniref:BREX system P-loop protein BrxC n=1 Tax=Bradyrhizobium sp. Ash2021 TaxID=2954771 RepID=UPI0028168400|nr:BREX system P-loop protein BrxC [Bradyrhizobium sp. Ash2021]WMT75399.1 BREX system P-loop protein BrxC [Bradyrhizobium sp. Ash2021]
MLLNKDVLARDPADYRLADGGVAKVSFPPDNDQKAILREQLQTFVCEGAYAEALRRIIDTFNGVAGKRGDVPAVWISGFYGSGKSLLASMLGALWCDLHFDDGASAEGLVSDMPDDVKAALKELRTNAKRLGGLVVGGSTLGMGSPHPVKAVLEVILRAVGFPGGADLRPCLVALWLAEQGILDQVRAQLGSDFESALRAFLLEDRLAAAALSAKSSLAPDVDTLMDRLGSQYQNEPEPTVELLVEVALKALSEGRKEIPLTLIILDEVQQFIREDPNISLAIQTIAEQLTSKFKGRLLLVCTGQSALSDTAYLEKLLGRFSIPVPLTSAHIDAVIRKTVLLKKDTTKAKADLEAMLNARSGEIDKHLQGSSLARSESDRAQAKADWPILAPRRRVWERVLAELDKSGLSGNLRGQLRLTLEAVQRYADRPLGTAVATDFLFDTFRAEALSRNLISRDVHDRIDTLRSQSGEGLMKARILTVVYLLSRIAADVQVHGVRPTPEIIADLLIEDLSAGAAVRAKVPTLLAELQTEALVMEVSGEWRLQTKESAEWLVAYGNAEARETSDANAIARQRAAFLQLAIDEALAAAPQVQHGASKTNRRIERLTGNDKASGDGLTLRIWNGWDDSLPTIINEINGADVAKDATLHLLIPDHRSPELRAAIIAYKAANAVIQRQGVPTTDGGKDAKAAMESKRDSAEANAKLILKEAVDAARVLVAGGNEVGAGLKRADAVREAGLQMLDRLFPDFGPGDSAAWEKAVGDAKKRIPDALKAVGHAGDAQDHPVCKALLKAMSPAQKGSELRNRFGGPPYGWPRDAVDAALVALCNVGQVRAVGTDGKPTTPADLTATQLGICTFTPEHRVISMKERLTVRGLATALGITVPSGLENEYLITIRDKLEQIAADAGGDAPVPAAPEVPDISLLRGMIGNDLLAELASRTDGLKKLIPIWQARRAEKDRRMAAFRLAERLVALGATGQETTLSAIKTGRTLLDEPNPVVPLVSAAADDLRAKANAGFQAWQAAWQAGQVRLKADEAWVKLSPEKKHEFLASHGLLERAPPDLATPDEIVESLSACGVGQWRDITLALPARVEAALQDAAIEIEPKTQSVAIPRRTLRSEADLDAWLGEVRAAIAPSLAHGPVLPKA